MKDYTGEDFDSLAGRLFPERAELFSKAPVKLIGIRGADDKPGQPNSFALYDDQILVCINGSVTSSWCASVDPSWYFVQNPIVKDSTGQPHTAQLCPGIHLFSKQNLHGEYPSFGQAEDIHIYRLNRDGSIFHIEYGQFGIFIHSGGPGMSTGRFSLGCQIIQDDDGYFGDPTWSNFYRPIVTALAAAGLDTFPYFLLNASDLPVAGGGAPIPRSASPAVKNVPVPTASAVQQLLSPLLSGSVPLNSLAGDAKASLSASSPSVLVGGMDRVQKALIQLGFQVNVGPGGVDLGYFGPSTKAALADFQKGVANLEPSGSLNQATLFALDQALLGMRHVQNPPAEVRQSGDASNVIPVPSVLNYLPPPSSKPLLEGVPFNRAVPIGLSYITKFAAADHGSAQTDPSRCRILLQFPNGTIYYDAKMAVDTDGSPNAEKIDPNPKDASTSTSWSYPGTKTSFDAEKVPYIVLPEAVKEPPSNFIKDMGLALGDVALVIYKDKWAGAIFVDEGPSFKIGEGSVRLHEMLDVNPWDKEHDKIIDSSIAECVLYFVFPGTRVDTSITAENIEVQLQQLARKYYAQLGGTLPAT